MHKLGIARFLAIAIVVGAVLAWAMLQASAASNVVSVLYAGSLVTPMEGPMKTALQERGIGFEGESGGSKALANYIAAGVRSPDVFIYVDPKLVAEFRDKVAMATTFAGTSLGIAWAPNSRYAALFDGVAAGKSSLQSALETPGLRIGRTDPQLDPKGGYTVTAMTMWLGSSGERRILGLDDNPSQIFPEQDLLARIDTGQADVGFFYRTEAVARSYRFVALPGDAAMTDRIAYTLAVMKNAQHPAAAKAFADFVLTGPGRAILEKAGLTYISQPIASRAE
ncbi:MAG TPA: extracellular solute-binding protein [Candidatus Cybelea sp.]|nr:extracellular solute-binding protein [Candidatus Cybelea sp.]